MPNVVSGDKVSVSVFPSFKKAKKEGEIIDVLNIIQNNLSVL